MKFIGCSASVNASGNGSQTFEICSLVQNSTNLNEFVTIAHDGMITIWSSETIKPLTSARIKCGYLTSLVNYEKGFIVGTGNGELIKFTNKLERQWTKKLHDDCVTDVTETQRYLVSIGSDGKVCFLSKPDLTIVQELDLQIPLSKITKIENNLYIAGNPSFKINLDNFKVTKERRSFHFVEFNERILSCSDEKGLQILGVEQHNEYIPCHFMLPFNGKLIVVSEEMIGIVDLKKIQGEEDEVSYRFYKTTELKKGFAIKTGLAYKEFIILAGEEGFIYKFQFKSEQESKG